MGAGKGGDSGVGEAAPEAAQPVVLKMNLHCAGCAHKVKKAIKRVPGVDSIVTDVAANTVVVAGTADAGALKARLEAKTNKPVEVVSAAGGAPKKPTAAEPKQDAGAGEKKGGKGASPNEEEKEKEKKQQAEEKKPKQQGETVLLKIRLHCDGCADRIRRRIYRIKGVKDVVMEANAKDEVEVTGTMDIPNMVSYLKEKLNRDVEAVVPPARKDGGAGGGEGKDDKEDSGSGGGKNKGAAGDERKDKGKGIESSSAGPSTAAAAAYMAAPAGASTYHVAPPHGYVAYEQAPPPASYYPYPYYGRGDGMGHANPSYHQQPQPDGNNQPQVAYPPYPYQFDMAPAPQLFSDENPNACSVM